MCFGLSTICFKCRQAPFNRCTDWYLGPKVGGNMKEMFNSYQIWDMRVFGVADYESEVGLKKNKMANPKWRTYFLKFAWLLTKIISGGFLGSLITNLRSIWRKTKWRIQNGGHVLQNLLECSRKLSSGGFWGRWLRICGQFKEKQNGGSKMAEIVFF